MVKEIQKVSQDKTWIDFQFHPFLANNFTLFTLAISTTQHTDINVHLRGKCKLNWLTWKIGLAQRENKRYKEQKKETEVKYRKIFEYLIKKEKKEITKATCALKSTKK